MGGITKSLIRFGVIAGLAAGGAALIAGPDRVAALATQARSTINTQIDHHIGDPAAMRHQLRELEAKYPERIAEVRAQIAEINEQARALERDKKVSERVVELARGDREELDELIARAEEAATEHGSARLIRIAFDDRTFGVDGAYARAGAIGETIALHQARAEDITTDLDALENDAALLKDLLTKLEREQSEFQAQIAQLDVKIDTIARKEKMAELMEQRQKRIDQLARFEVGSLDQLRAKLAKQHAELDARIASASERDRRSSYEDRARYDVDADASRELRIETEREAEPTRTIIRDGESSDDQDIKTIARR